ncbi:hypothetical protein LguiA_032524 [Lonicera macranthoides]
MRTYLALLHRINACILSSITLSQRESVTEMFWGGNSPTLFAIFTTFEGKRRVGQKKILNLLPLLFLK